MRINRCTVLLACAAITAGLSANTASAQGHDASLSLALPLLPMLASSRQDNQDPVRISDRDGTSMGSAIDAGRLESLRGGESTVDNDVVIDGTVDGNTADHVVSGSNSISDGAFSNATGINTVIQNTGSNVLIQNGMVVNVQFVAPTP